jgi:hypothetical protein
MKNFTRLAVYGLFILVFFSACAEEPGPNDPASIRDNYLGQWLVSENTGRFAPQSYSVEVVAGTADNEMVIEGLYNLPATRVLARINGLSLSIANQSTNGVTFNGSGTSNADYDQISLSFTANDGTGPDNVEAVMVP